METGRYTTLYTAIQDAGIEGRLLTRLGGQVVLLTPIQYSEKVGKLPPSEVDATIDQLIKYVPDAGQLDEVAALLANGLFGICAVGFPESSQ